jgi:predicted RNA-binding protein associated with RNAse of E/G family
VWSSGDVVALREIWHGRVWKARPWIVVEDQSDLMLLWIPRGAKTALPNPAELPIGDWQLTEGTFRTNALRVTRSGAAHSILHFFGDDGAFRHWYVNLERPLVRSAVGFNLADLFLDIVIERDGAWRWDDEDELEAAVRTGLISQEDADAARAEGERVLAEWPFPTGWEDWRPDPCWKPPRLPAGWDVI